VKIILITLFLLTLPTKAKATLNQDVLYGSEVANYCEKPEYLHPDAQDLTDSFLLGELLRSEYLEQFIWLEPNLEAYAICLVCSSSYSSLSRWESGLAISCPSDAELGPQVLTPPTD
jgi:hypothetical protein